MFFMPAHVYGEGSVIVKIASVNSENSTRGIPTVLLTIFVYDAITGLKVAEVEAERLTALRTAASSAVATDLMARKDARVLGIYGSGIQAASHIEALTTARGFDKLIVYSRERPRREAFAKKWSRETDLSVTVADNPSRLAAESDVIVTATTSSVPVFNGKLVKKGAYVNSIGAATADAREVDTDLVRRSMVVVDSRSQAVTTYGDIVIPISEGAIKVEEILELGDVLKDRTILGRGEREVSFFKSGGLAVLDALVAAFVVNSHLQEKSEV